MRRSLRRGGISKAGAIRTEPTCRELVALLAEYLSSELSREQAGAFDAHLAQCCACQNYTRAYGATITASETAFNGPEAFVPVSDELVQAILESRRNHS